MTLETKPHHVFVTKSVNPESMTPEREAEMYLEAHKLLQEIAISSGAKEEVVKQIRADHPILVYVVGDLHFGHIASAHEEILSLRERILANPYAAVVFVGDEVEGFTTKYPTTSTSQTHATGQQQIDMIQTLLFKPLAEEGRVLALVSEYFGHPGWFNDASTLDPWKLMAKIDSLAELEKLKIQVLTNGGTLTLEFPNGHRQSMIIRHNPPGKSKYDPLHGLRLLAQGESVEMRPNGYASGHFHTAAIGIEQEAGSDIPYFMVSSGTAKGSRLDKPRDKFGVRIGAPLADPTGQGVVIRPRHRGVKFDRNYPFIYPQQGETAHTALEILDYAEKNKLTEELMGEIRQVDHPEISLRNKESKVVHSGHPYTETERGVKAAKKKKEKENGSSGNSSGDEKRPDRYHDLDLAPVYDSLTYDINSQLPIALHLMSNARIGSTVEGVAALKNFQRDLNPQSFIVYLRNMIDASIAKDKNRVSVLNRMARLMKKDLESQQIIAILLDENLRKDDWKKDLGDDCPPPGSFLSHQTNTPLIHHLSFIKIAVGPGGAKFADKPLYVGAFADGLEGHGSRDKATFGLLQLYNKKLASKPGYVAGGHMPNSGTMMFHHSGNSETEFPALIAPGWWSNYIDTQGNKNVKLGSLPGQAIIFMPGTSKSERMVFPTVNADQTRYMHDALLLLKGLQLLGRDINDFLPR